MPITCYFNVLDCPITNPSLGNMLFQIATTYALAIDNKDKCHFQYLKDYYDLVKAGNKYKDNIFRKLSLNNITIKKFKEYEWNYEPIIYQKSLKISGYFCSYKYFHHHYSKIVELFEPSIDIVKYISAKYRLKYINSISIHIRRGDYTKLSNFCVYDFNYVNNALDIIKNKVNVNNSHIFIFSDDTKWCEKNINNINNYNKYKIKIIKEKSDIIEFYFMSMCNHNIIINSTFSWWAAYLNQHKNKIVIMPKIWFNKDLEWGKNKNEEQLYVPEWIII